MEPRQHMTDLADLLPQPVRGIWQRGSGGPRQMMDIL
jgi:hypothetical protein